MDTMEKMHAGVLYDPADEAVLAQQQECLALL